MTVKERFTRFLNNKPLKHKLYVIIFESDTPAGKMFDVALIVCIALSILLAILESLQGIPSWLSTPFIIFEYLFTAFFTFEYVTRIYCSPQPKKYIFSFFGIIDLLATLFPAGSTLSIGYPGIPYYSGVSYIQAFHLLDGRRTIANFTQREQ